MAKRSKRRDDSASSVYNDESINGVRRIPIKPLNRTQKEYCSLIERKQIVLAEGSAGSGKTHLGALYALDGYLSGQYKKIVLCRPYVAADNEKIGFLPGNINDKLDPFIRPIYDAFQCHIPMSRVKTMLEFGHLEIIPMAFMRGRSLHDCFILADECQNASIKQMLMLLTRLGENSKLIVTGDPSQRDLDGETCFDFARRKLSQIPEIGFIRFSDRDVVRSEIVAKILDAWNDSEVANDEIGILPKFIRESRSLEMMAAAD